MAEDPARLEAVALLGRLLSRASTELPLEKQPNWDALLATVQQMAAQARKKGVSSYLRAVVDPLLLVLKEASQAAQEKALKLDWLSHLDDTHRMVASWVTRTNLPVPVMVDAWREYFESVTAESSGATISHDGSCATGMEAHPQKVYGRHPPLSAGGSYVWEFQVDGKSPVADPGTSGAMEALGCL